MLGAFAGRWIMSNRNLWQKFSGLAAAGVILLAAGCGLHSAHNYFTTRAKQLAVKETVEKIANPKTPAEKASAMSIEQQQAKANFVKFMARLLPPINKRLWTVPFVLVTCGYGLLLFAVFYTVIDGWGWKWIGYPLAVIGANAILIYLAFSFVDWRYTSNHIFGGFFPLAPKQWYPLLRDTGVFLIEWLLVLWLYRKKIFFKV